MRRRRVLASGAAVGIIPLSGCLSGAKAQFNFTPPNPSVGESVVFEAQDKSGSTYEWYFDKSVDRGLGGTTPDAKGTVVAHEFEQSGAHTVTLYTAKNGILDLFNPLVILTGGLPNTFTQPVYVGESSNVSDQNSNSIDASSDIVSLQLRGITTRVNTDETAIVFFSAVNLSEQQISVNLVLQVPSGMTIQSSSLTDSGGGQYAGTFELAEGENASTRIRVKPTRTGKFEIRGIADISPTDGETETYDTYIPIIVE